MPRRAPRQSPTVTSTAPAAGAITVATVGFPPASPTPSVPPRPVAGGDQANGDGGEAQRLYEALLAGAKSERTRRSLRHVWAALQSLAKRRGAEITKASVAREIELLGLPGPKEQSIRNPEGRIYQDLITTFVRERGGRRPAREASDAERLIAGIDDVVTQTQVKHLIADNVSLRNQINFLQDALRRLRPVDLTGGGSPAAAAESGLSETERRTFREFLRNLDEIEGLVRDEDTGALRSPHFDIAGPGFLQAMRRLAG